jgi:hypothetical protein
MATKLGLPLFDDIRREDPSPCGELEDSFSFLNRVDTPFWGEVRRVAEEWFSRYPEGEGEGLRRSFRSRESGKHHAAWWELYLHEFFTRLAYEIEIHPPLPDSPRRPDFLLRKEDAQVYVEAAVVFSGITRTSEKAPPWLLDAINNAKSPNFFVRLVAVPSQGEQQLKRREIADPIERWLGSLDPDEALENHEQEGRPVESFPCRGWEVVLEAWPVKREKRGRSDRRTLGIGLAQAGFVNDVEQLRGTLKKKAGRYGHPGAPFVIAVRSMSGFMELLDIEQALFGDEAAQVPCDGSHEAPLFHRRNGLWTGLGGPDYQRVSAVITGAGLHEANINKQGPSLWLNPWAHHPLTEDWPLPKYSATDQGEVLELGGHFDPGSFFDLPEDWPGGRPFPRE